jgi:hypothetical protein
MKQVRVKNYMDWTSMLLNVLEIEQHWRQALFYDLISKLLNFVSLSPYVSVHYMILRTFHVKNRKPNGCLAFRRTDAPSVWYLRIHSGRSR